MNNTKNRQSDLHDHLFMALERLGDEDLKGETLKEEIARAHAITGVASQIIANGNLALNAFRAVDNASKDLKLPRMLTE